MSFYDRYELLELVRDDGIKTFNATQLSSGRSIAVHILVGGSNPQNQTVLDYLRSLLPEDRRVVIETGEHEGTTFIVTEPWNRPQGFREWLQGARSRAASVVASSGPKTIRPMPAEDQFAKAGSWRIPNAEFTRKAEKTDPSLRAPVMATGDLANMCQTPERATGSTDPRLRTTQTMYIGQYRNTPPVPEPEPGPPVPSPLPPDPEPPTPTYRNSVKQESSMRNDEPGEFTRMFKAGNPAAPSAPQSTPPPVPEPPGAGEFTRMFEVGRIAPKAEPKPQPVAPPPPPPVAPPAPPAHGSGEFTRMFEAMKQPAGVEPPPAAKQQPSSSPKNDEAGEFTRMFQAPASPVQQPASEFARAFKPEPPPAPPAPPPAPVQEQPGEFTRMFKTGPQATPAPPPPASSDPGEFTRMFKTAPQVVPPAQPPAQSQPQPPPPAKSDPGDFTRMFKTAPQPVPPQVSHEPPKKQDDPFSSMFQAPPAPPQQPPTPAQPLGHTPVHHAGSKPGEFTGFFEQKPEAPNAHPALKDPFAKQPGSAPGSSGMGAPGEYTRMFGAPGHVAAPPPPPSGSGYGAPVSATGAFNVPSSAPPPPPSAPAVPPGPGEYTRMFTPPAPADPAPAANPAGMQAPAPAARTSYLPLILILGVIAIIAIAVILYFALSGK